MVAGWPIAAVLFGPVVLLASAPAGPSAQGPVGPGQPPAERDEQGQVEPAGIKVSPTGTVDLHVTDQPLATVLRLLSVQGQRNIITTPAVQGRVTADLYEVTFDEALEAILVANQCGYLTRGSFIYVYTNEELAGLAEARYPPATRVFRLYYINAAEAATAVEPLLSETGSVNASPTAEQGISPDASSAGGDMLAAHDYLVIHDYPDRLAEVERVLAEIDVRPQQVLVEATILRASLSDENSLGVDFTLLGGVDLEVLGSTSTGITGVTTGELPTSRFEEFNSTLQTDFTSGWPAGGVTFGVVKDHVGIFVRALEQVTDTVLLANPKILCLNKQKGQIHIGRRDGYITTTVTETQAIQTVEFLETGTQLIFRPFIGKDGDVRMELHPEDSIGGLTPANLPHETTTELTTNVQCRDGQTILIGGLFREVITDGRSQVPLLGDIPVVGQAFRSNRDDMQTEEVIILLTVHIVKDDEAYAEASVQQLEDFERVRVGLRRGLMWHGRERLAQAHYRRALEHFAEGDLDRALWDLRMSLHNLPRMLPAIKLREEILRQRDWEDEGSVTREFVAQLIMHEAGVEEGRRRFGRPPLVPAIPDDARGPTGFDHDHASGEQ